AVGAVRDEEPTLRIHREAVRRVELARTAAFLSPGLDEFAVLREFDDARVGIAAMAIRDEDVPVRRGDHVGGLVEGIVAVTGGARLAERHEDLPVLVELDDDVAFALLAL